MNYLHRIACRADGVLDSNLIIFDADIAVIHGYWPVAFSCDNGRAAVKRPCLL